MGNLPPREKLEHLIRSYVPRGFWADLSELIDQLEREVQQERQPRRGFLADPEPASAVGAAR